MKKPVVLKVLSALLAVGSVPFLGTYGAYLWSLWRVWLSEHTVPNTARSIGIISGADGPTAIFITVGARMEIYLLLGGILLAGALGLFLWAGKLGKKQG